MKTNHLSAVRRFIDTWKGRGYEKGDTQSFWCQLLHDVFGVEIPANFIKFELPVHLASTKFIDAYIPSTKVIIEQKEIGKSLDSAARQSDGEKLTPYEQAQRYVGGLSYSQYPRWIVVCNFQVFKVYDMEQPQAEPIVLSLENLEREFYLLRFLVNDETTSLRREKALSIQAGELVGKLYDEIKQQYVDPNSETSLHSLNVLCIRLVFCLFAEKSFLFGDSRSAFSDYLKSYKSSQMRRALIDLFDVLDTPESERDPYLSKELADFPYVNGGLFDRKEPLEVPKFTGTIADLLLNECSSFDWSSISPTIFGALFEDTMNPDTRELGCMHYTSPENIHRVIDPLFLNALNREFKDILIRVKSSKKLRQELVAFQNKIASLTFLDPACGSGNFLTETYLSLRHLENDVLKMLGDGNISLNGDFSPIKVRIENFYGIETNDFAVNVAKAALWIAEAQMMEETAQIVQRDFDFLPLKSYSHIVHADALKTDWNLVAPMKSLSYIMGNPPFKGKKSRKNEQKEELVRLIGGDCPHAGNLDYVTGWFIQAARCMQHSEVRTAFVTTVNITRGEQAALLWQPLLETYNIKIQFAHLPFVWNSESKKKAQVHCVVIGLSRGESGVPKLIYSESSPPVVAQNISPYLRDEKNVLVESRPGGPICDVPPTGIGNKPIDGGFFLFKPEEKDEFVKKEPMAERYFYEWYGADELIKGHRRYFLWLAECPPEELRKMPLSKRLIECVKGVRMKSSSVSTQKLADFPTRFHVTNIPKTNFIVIPEVTSENRDYIPMEYVETCVSSKKLFSNLVKLMPDATIYHFGVLQSCVHMTWTRAICGYKDFRPRYSTDVVFNNFPWPNVSSQGREAIEKTARGILDARRTYPKSSLADLYDVDTMPELLRKAHQANDRAVMKAYGFYGMNETEIMSALLQLYVELSNKLR